MYLYRLYKIEKDDETLLMIDFPLMNFMGTRNTWSKPPDKYVYIFKFFTRYDIILKRKKYVAWTSIQTRK